jgi:hypothetical protein
VVKIVAKFSHSSNCSKMYLTAILRNFFVGYVLHMVSDIELNSILHYSISYSNPEILENSFVSQEFHEYPAITFPPLGRIDDYQGIFFCPLTQLPR